MPTSLDDMEKTELSHARTIERRNKPREPKPQAHREASIDRSTLTDAELALLVQAAGRSPA